jgi:tetratricopeptide (TPR) repeat protein
LERAEALSVLELGNAATRDEIKGRAIKLLNEFHPDKHAEVTGNATLKKLLEENFNKVREARDYLLNSSAPPEVHARPSPDSEESTVEFTDSAQVLGEIIKRAANAGDWASVAEGAVRLAKASGNEQAARRLLARASIHLGNFGIAAEAARAATNFDSSDDEAWFLLALVRAKQEKWQEASVAIREAIDHSHTAERQYEDLRVDIECGRSPQAAAANFRTAPSTCPRCKALFSFKDGACRGCGFPRPLHVPEQGQVTNAPSRPGDTSPESFDFLHPVETLSGRLVVGAFGIIGGGLCAAFWGWSGFIVGGIVSALVATAALAGLAAFVEATRRSAINPIGWVFTMFVAGLAFAGTWYVVYDMLKGGSYSSVDSYLDAAESFRRTATVVAGVVATIAGLIAYGTVRAVSGRPQSK